MSGVYTSRRRVLRLMAEHGLLAPSRVGSPRGPRNRYRTIIPDAVDAHPRRHRVDSKERGKTEFPSLFYIMTSL